MKKKPGNILRLKENYENVFQFKITLAGVEPEIWRQIQVPETFSFFHLHLAIQDVMGWANYHMHEFSVEDPATGMIVHIGEQADSDMSDFGYDVLEESEHKLTDYFSGKNKKATYTYDFGDDWVHLIKFEKKVPKDKSLKYPVCLAGKRACPPEDSGGSWGYMELLDTLKDKDSEDYTDTLEWVGEDFDPEHFDKDEVKFRLLY